ncbi:FAD binding domain-containing protein [Colletotrichum tofieldiae]|uniref:FAD binding domain-containing protein n=1 Tax=Colletotrichum tofieldiae TaxID=708197 RepID=A0A166TEP4_9PEZI|nr:FAD binding domain-containing protein [Colletotrichum tofieldiae]GKT84495.1 FAD binding domain-containing protein [Colletotrichum tofieldiae]
MTSDPFKVIIVGGGPSGITAAYALHHAGIDFVVLERRTNVVEDLGASLVLGPDSLRVFHQFGILDQLTEIGCKLSDNKGLTTDGQVFKSARLFNILANNHGSGPVAFHRAHLIQALYDNLPESAKARYFTGKKLAGIESTETGVAVTCEDGSSYSGSIVLGADGVHSATRRQMRQLAIAEDPAREEAWDAVKPYKTNYQCMWASFPRLTEVGQTYETYGTDRSAMYLSGTERGWIFLYEKLPEITTERIAFSDEQLEEYAGKFADWPITETLKVKDVFKERFNAGGAGLEEGICKNWSWNGRIVLVGDAAHKFTPNAGLGFNNGVQDVVTVCNKLQKFVSESGEKGTGTKATDFSALERVFNGYRDERQERLGADLEASAKVTRMHAWASTWDWFMSRYVMSWAFVEKLFITYVVTPKVQQSVVVDFISKPEPFEGTYKWLHPLLKTVTSGRAP